MLLLVGFQFLEQANIHQAQHGDDAAQENNQNQHQRHQRPTVLRRIRRPGAVYAVVPVGIRMISIVHRKPLRKSGE